MKLESSKPTLILFCGLPGSGKTTLAKKLERELPAVRLCPDEWLDSLGLSLHDEELRTKLEVKLWEHAQQLLRFGQNVIVENGLWSRQERDGKRSDVAGLDIEIELHYLAVPLGELLRRIKVRNKTGGHGIVPVTRAEMESYAKMFQAPDEAELALFTRWFIHRP